MDQTHTAVRATLFLGAAALFYDGDEIGMKTTPPTRKQDVKDPVGLRDCPSSKGVSGKLATLLKSPGGVDPASLQSIALEPFGVYVGEVG